MTILIFIIILLVLVLIHEAGHFFAAKISGVKVEEFAFGFPPRLFSIKKGETTYAFNALPLGGYVKIFGENGEEEIKKEGNSEPVKLTKDKRNFTNKHPILKIFILSAGVIMNILLAYILVTASVYINTTFSVDGNSQEYQAFLKEGRVKNERVIIANVVKGSPAQLAGLAPGYVVARISSNQENLAGQVKNTKDLDLSQSGEEITEATSKIVNNLNSSYSDSLTIEYKNKKGEDHSTTVAGVYNLNGVKDRKMIGLSFTKVASINLKFGEAVKLGFYETTEFIRLTLIGFKDLFVNLFQNGKMTENIAGPVGIINEVGNAKALGFDYLLLFTAVLSISLAVFNILPLPALDGGRILFVIIEWVSGKKISNKWQMILNGTGFTLLILLMVFVTIKDVMKLF